MGMRSSVTGLLSAAGLFLAGTSMADTAASADEWGTALTLNQSFGTLSGIHEVARLEWDFTDAYFTGIAISQRLYDTGFGLSFEVEGHANRHYGDAEYWEGVAAIGARWDRFPWSDHVETSFAVLQGVSYYTGRSAVEETRLDKTSKTLNYLGIELELSPPGDTAWSTAVRLHHRSGVFGLYDGVSGGSNYFSLGLRYRF
jgi:hypothetical protein